MIKNIFNQKFNNFFQTQKYKLLIILITTIILILICALWVHLRYSILFPGAAHNNNKVFNQLSNNNKEKFLQNKFIISKEISSTLEIKKNYILYQKNLLNQKSSEKILVIFLGNGTSMDDILYDFKDLKCLKVYNKYDNLMFINYPFKAYSQKKVINYGYNAIKDLIEKNYKSENIDVIGVSIGGAVSANVLRKLKKEDNIKIGNYFNVNSFSKINKVIPFAPEFLQKRFLRKIISTLSSILFLGFSLNAEKAYQ
jgi:hypothetical protein